MVIVVAVNVKSKFEISMSLQSKLYGMKGNLLSCMFCLEFVVCLKVLFPEIGGINLDAVWGIIK